MALTKVTYGLLSADTSAIDLNIDANTLYVDSSANKVGIQTNSPSLALEVNDTSNVDGEQISIKGHANYGGTVVFRRGDSFNWRVGVGGGSSTNSTIPSSYFGFEQGNTTSMVIAHTTGYVGIGTTNPGRQFHIQMPNLAAGTGNGIRITDDSALMEIGLRKDGSGNRRLAIFEDGGTYPLVLQEDGGNVGIGTTSPDTNLDITTAGAHGIILNQDTGNGAVSGRLFFKDSTRTNAILNVNGNLELRTGAGAGSGSGTRRLVVNGDGTITFNDAYTFPTADGSANQVLQTDGSGALSFATVSGLPLSGGTLTGALQITSAKTQSGGAPIGNLLIADSTSLAANTGGGITFQGVYQSGGNITGLASIEAMKETATHNEYGGALVLKAREDQGAMNEVARFTSTGNLQFSKKGTNFVSPGFTYHTNNYLYLRGGSAGLVLADDSSINTVQIVDGSSGYINFETGDGTSRMRIDASGKVGIGTTSPQKTLHIEHTGGASEGILITGASDTVGHTAGILLRAEGGESDSDLRAKGGIFFERTGTYGVGKLHLANDVGADNTSATISDAKLTINTSGNVGIGTTSPAQLLHLKSTGDAVLKLEADSDNVTETDNAYIEFQQDGGLVNAELGFASGTNEFTINQKFNAEMRFRTNNTNRMSILSDGSVLVNTTVDSDNQTMRIAQTGSNADPALALSSDTGDQSYYRYIKFYRKGQSGSVAKLDIDWSGSSIGLSFTSDARLKTVTGEADGLELITRLNPVKYVWKSEPDRHGAQGFLAQEVEQAYYETGNSHARGVSRPIDGEEHYMLDDTTLIPNLVKAIKELKDENDALKARVEALES